MTKGTKMEENVYKLWKLLASFTQHAEDIRFFIVEHKWKHNFENEIVATEGVSRYTMIITVTFFRGKPKIKTL